MSTIFPPFDPDGPEQPRKARFRPVPFRMILPNLVTLLALCAGLTGIRMAIEDRLELALAAIVLAAMLDAVAGRVARYLKSTSRFGAELDSLADFVNFGVAPAMVLYTWLLFEARSLGWIAALVFAICTALRLARFNVALDNPATPDWQRNFFKGVPAPAGALTVLLPIYLELLGMPRFAGEAQIVLVYVLVIALLMVSQLPTWSGKKMGQRIPREMVLPLFVLVVLFVALLVSFPWHVLTFTTLVYLLCLPLGWRAWRGHMATEGPEAQVIPDVPDSGDESTGI